MNPLQLRPSNWYNKLDALFQLVVGFKNQAQKWRSLSSRSAAVPIFFAMAQPLLRPRHPVRENRHRCAYSAEGE
jgi:hypothetical protein